MDYLSIYDISDDELAALPYTPEVEAEMHRRLYLASRNLADELEQPLPLDEAAKELGWTLEQLIEQLVKDGLLIEVNGELIASPHPDIVRLKR